MSKDTGQLSRTGLARRLRGLVRKYPGLVFVATPCLAAAVIVSLVWSPAGSSGNASATAPVDVTTVAQDRPAPQFDLPLLSGSRRLALHSLRGNVVVLNFWASWCNVCHQDAPVLRRLAGAYRHSDVTFVGVDHGDVSSAARAFVRRNDLTYPTVVDPGDLLRRYGGIGLPMTYVIDRAGRIRYQTTGSIDSDQLRRAIEHAAALRSP
jgi:cytochrome c biogenesis protein CcmG/thiol:disulfide interchange protein DsbE